MKAWVRKAVAECLGIIHDKDVRTTATSVPPGEVEDWVDGDSTVVPGLRPMKIDWLGGNDSEWNYAVFLKFADYMASSNMLARLPRNVPAPEAETLQLLFYNRLKTLRKTVLAAQPRVDGETGVEETQEEIWARLRQADKHQLSESRNNTRRETVIMFFFILLVK